MHVFCASNPMKKARGRPKKNPPSKEPECNARKQNINRVTCTHCKCKCRPNAKKKSGGKCKSSTSMSTEDQAVYVARKIGGKRKNSSSTSNID